MAGLFIFMRIRTIKPEFFLHEGLYALEAETKLPIRISFAGLWCIADREGRFKWEPRKIGVQVLPYDLIDFSRVLDALTTRGFVLKYASENETFGCIPSFGRHQVINNRERDSELPTPTDCNICDASTTRASRVATRGQSRKAEGKGREGNREGKGMEGEESLTLPFCSSEFSSAWIDWLEFRQSKKKPVSLIAQKQTFKDFVEWGESASIESIRQSIKSDWQGLFAPKGKPQANKPKHAGIHNQTELEKGF